MTSSGAVTSDISPKTPSKKCKKCKTNLITDAKCKHCQNYFRTSGAKFNNAMKLINERSSSCCGVKNDKNIDEDIINCDNLIVSNKISIITKEESKLTKGDLYGNEPLLKQYEQECAESFTTEIDCPDGGYGWVIVACCFYCSMLVEGVMNCFGIYLSELVNEFGETEGRTAWIGSILAGFTLLVGPLASLLANKYGCRSTAIAGGVLASSSLVVSIFCPTVTWLMVVYGFCGIGLGLNMLPAVVSVGHYFDSKRELANGIAMTGTGFGTCVFPPMVNYLVTTKGWKTANLCLAAITLGAAFCGVLMKPLKKKTMLNGAKNQSPSPPPSSNLIENKQSYSAVDISCSNKLENMLCKQNSSHSLKINPIGSRNGSKYNDVGYFPSEKMRTKMLPNINTLYSGSAMSLNVLNQANIQNSEEELKSLLDFGLLKDLKFILFGLTNIFAMISNFIPFLFIVEMAKTNGIEASQASLLISVAGIVYAISQLSLGYIVSFPILNPLLVNSICLFMGTIAVSIMPFCVNFTSYIFTTVLFGISLAGFISLAPIIIVDLLGVNRLTSGFGIILLFRGAAVFLGCPLAGAIVDFTHSFKTAFYIAGALFTISSLLGFALQFMKQKRRVIDV